jgi:hypothetical protein
MQGSSCPFRHSAPARLSKTTCTAWISGVCTDENCPDRHFKDEKNRNNTPCYWESQPEGFVAFPLICIDCHLNTCRHGSDTHLWQMQEGKLPISTQQNASTSGGCGAAQPGSSLCTVPRVSSHDCQTAIAKLIAPQLVASSRPAGLSKRLSVFSILFSEDVPKAASDSPIVASETPAGLLHCTCCEC